MLTATVDGGWQRSTFCSGGNCVQVKRSGNTVMVRDRGGRIVTFTATAWQEFLAGAEAGEFTPPAEPTD